MRDRSRIEPPQATETVELGTFDVISGQVAIADPCYRRRDVPSLGVLTEATNGTYHAVIEKIQGLYGRVSRLYAIHDDAFRGHGENPRALSLVPFDEGASMFSGAGVDSGQMSICDADLFRGGDDMTWYNMLCDITLDYEHDQSGTFDGGCVSSSGYGDGFYPVMMCQDGDGNEMGWCVVFIDDNELGEEEDEL